VFTLPSRCHVEEIFTLCNWVCKGGGRKAPPGARSRAAPGLVRLRAPGGAQDMALYT